LMKVLLSVQQGIDLLKLCIPHHARKWRGRGIFDVVLLRVASPGFAFSSVV